MTKNFPNRGHTHEFNKDIGNISGDFEQAFGIYFQKDFGSDFKRTTKKFGLKFNG